MEKLGGVAGLVSIGFGLTGVAVLPILTFPATTQTASQISSFTAQHRERLQVMMLLYTLAVALWLVFGASVWARIRSSLGAGSDIPTVFAAGLIGFVSLLLVGFAAFDVLVYRPEVPESRL